jgi:CHAT domain-containing protein
MKKSSYAQTILIILLNLFVQHGMLNLAITPVASQSMDTFSDSSTQQADNSIVNGDLKKAITLLDRQWEAARKNNNKLGQARAMHRLQLAHYIQGGGRRSTVYTAQLLTLRGDPFGSKNENSKEFESYIIDTIILFSKQAIESGEQSGYGSSFSSWIGELRKIEERTSDVKNLVKIYSGLAYLYKNNQQQEEAVLYFKKLNSLDLNSIQMGSIEKISFLLTYTEVLQIFNTNIYSYEEGVRRIVKIRDDNNSKIPILTSYFDLNIAHLYFTVGQYKKSIASLQNSFNRINHLPYYLKFLTLELLADNHELIDDDLLQSNQLYSKVLFESESIRFSQGSDLVNSYLEDRVTIKQLRVRTRQKGINDSDIQEITQLSSQVPYPLSTINSQSRWNNLRKDTLLVEDKLLKRGATWDAFVTSEVTRGQFTRFSSQPDSYRVRDAEGSARLCYERKKSCENINEYLQGVKISGGQSIFPVTAQKLAKIISSQDEDLNGKTRTNTSVSKKSRTTIVQYFYDFYNQKPNEIHFYVFQPQSNLLKVKPIVRCLNLQAKTISETCQKYQTPVKNSLGEINLSQAKKEIDINGMSKYIRVGVDKVINCKDNQKSNCSPKEVDRVLKQFYQLLLEPISDLLPNDPEDKIIFVPQGDLFSVPFTALKDSSDKYMIEKATISIVPSILLLSYASDLKAGLNQDRVKNNKFLILGNPVISEKLSDLKLNRLPFAEQEALEIARLYKTNPLLGQNATKEKLIESFYNVNMIHLATHAAIDYANTFDSSIILSPTASNPTGKIALKDIQNRMKAELVVVSSCSSAKGKINTDGINGFSSKLILSGNPSQVLSLWPVNDESTHQLMVDFHRNLFKGKSKTYSLRQAMLDTMKNKKYADPYYWAPFTLIGNTQ